MTRSPVSSTRTLTRHVPSGLSLRVPLLKAAEQTTSFPLWQDPVAMGLIGAGGGGLLALLWNAFLEEKKRRTAADALLGALIGGLGGLGFATYQNYRKNAPILGPYTQRIMDSLVRTAAQRTMARARQRTHGWAPLLAEAAGYGLGAAYLGGSVERLWRPHFGLAVDHLRRHLAQRLAADPALRRRAWAALRESGMAPRSLGQLLGEVAGSRRGLGEWRVVQVPGDYQGSLPYGLREGELRNQVARLMSGADLHLAVRAGEADAARQQVAHALADAQQQLQASPSDARLQRRVERLQRLHNQLSATLPAGQSEYLIPGRDLPDELVKLRDRLLRAARQETAEPQIRLGERDFAIQPTKPRWWQPSLRGTRRATLTATPEITVGQRLGAGARTMRNQVTLDLPAPYLADIERVRSGLASLRGSRLGRFLGPGVALAYLAHGLMRR